MTNLNDIDVSRLDVTQLNRLVAEGRRQRSVAIHDFVRRVFAQPAGTPASETNLGIASASR
ncbi:hypothetical protein ACKTEK_03795 [Tepidamorphus sp. 3E244]|uniref:hypothetical protein n=1 Tax=Tepidamorphus sp. 3E244 TaxID=3385498 RepID=UPI0038FCE895